MGETLTADTSGIADADGLNGARFQYQWLSSTDTEIQGATGKTYPLNSTDEGKTIKVRVSFTDDALNQEVLTSAATTEIAAGSDSPGVGETPEETSVENTSVPGAPTNLNVSYRVYGHGEGITLRWWAPGGSVTGYQILRQRSGCDDDYLVYVEDTGSGTTTYTDTDVVEGVRYYYLVKAINSVGVGSQSNFASAQYPWLRDTPASGAPSAPSRLDSTLTNDGVELTWEAPDEEVTGYQILRRTPELCEPVLRVHVENTDSTDTHWMDTDVEVGTLYEYRVAAINDSGVGKRSFIYSTRPRRASAETGYIALILSGGFPLAPGQSEEIAISIGPLERDDDPDTVDYTLRGDVTLDDGSDADACEGEGLGENIQISIVDERSYGFNPTFGGPGCGAGTYTFTLVLTDGDGTEVATFEFLEFQEVGGGGPQNTPATGQPTISGTAEVGETLTADTSGISDEDGLNNATFSYQWLRTDDNSDTDIAGANSASYVVASDDVGKTLKVRVSYTDDAENEETLTSTATAVVEATVPGAPRSLDVQPSATGRLTVSWEAPASNGGSDITGYTVQWKESSNSWDTAADVSSATTTETSYTITGLSPGTEYTIRVLATNLVGNGPASAEESATTEAQTSQVVADDEPTQPVPATPDQPTGRALWAGLVDVEWNEVPDTDSYEVQYFYIWRWIDLPGEGIDISFYGAGAVVKDLATYRSNYFRVRARNSAGASEWSQTLGLPQTGGSGAWTDVPKPVNSAATGAPSISGTPQVARL